MKFIPNIRSALRMLLPLCIPAILTSQNIPNYTFSNAQSLVCPYDSSTYWGFDEWSAFQTDDSTRWGTKDSFCISPSPFPVNNAALRVRDYDITKPVYLDANLEADSIYVTLDSNNLYRFSVSQFFTNTTRWEFGTNCKEDLCTGLELGIQIPDSAGTGFTTRWYKHEPDPFSNSYAFCIPTERFPNGNKLSRLWLKYTNNSNASAQDSVRIYGVYIEDMRGWTEQIRSIDATFFNGTSYEFQMEQWTGNCFNYFCSNKLLMYTDSTYPNANDISYVEVAPSPNTTTQENIDIIVGWDVYLTAQPFTQLRGAQVVGDTLRHTYNVINNGGTVCTYGLIEVIFEGGNSYIHQAGKVNFGSKGSCMLFGRGSSLEVADGTTFHYGAPGLGMLAIKTGGKLTIGRGSELVVHNKLVFGEYEDDPEPADIHIYLDRGSKLTFAPGSELSNQFSKFKDVCLLNVHLRGGELDDSGLSEEDRKLIRRIYDDPRELFAENVDVLGNPFSGELSVSILSEGGEEVELTLYGLDGKVYGEREVQLKQGYNGIEMDTGTLPAGVYLLQVDNGAAAVTERVLKLE